MILRAGDLIMPMPDARAPRATILTLSLLALAAVSLLAGGLGAPRASAAAGQPVSGLTAGASAGQITSGTTTAPPSGSSGWCLDNSGGSASAGNAIDIYSCNDTWDAQMWTVEDDGTLRIQNMCLDVKGGSSANGTPVLLNTCNGSGSPGEQWQPQANGSLLNVNSGKCLGISGTVGNGATAMIWSCDGADTQVWNLPLPAPGPAAASAAARLQLMYDPGDGLFDPSGDCTKVAAPAGNCWWWSANELNALIDFGWQERALTMSTAFPGWYAFQNDLSVTFATYADGCTPSSTDACTGLFTHDGFFDDAGWWGLTWLNAYNYTGDAQYLYLAENILGYIHGQGWDPSSCGGGVWQVLNTGAFKDAISNELYLELAARLYRATGNSTYLGYANAEWAWFKANLIVEGPQTSPPTGGNATGYLTPAQAIANTVEGDTQDTADQPAGAYSTPALVDVYGTLSEACQALESPGDWPDDCDVTGPHQYFLQFKGVFIRNLACLSQDAAGSPAYASFIGRNATSVLDADQDTTTTFGADPDLNLFGFLWDNNGNPWPGTETAILNEATQGSALDALVANVGASYAMC